MIKHSWIDWNIIQCGAHVTIVGVNKIVSDVLLIYLLALLSRKVLIARYQATTGFSAVSFVPYHSFKAPWSSWSDWFCCFIVSKCLISYNWCICACIRDVTDAISRCDSHKNIAFFVLYTKYKKSIKARLNPSRD